MFCNRSSNLISIDKWANEQAAAHGSKHSFQIPSDIKPGTYVVRTELLALHGNTLGGSVKGAEFYVGCFNVDVIGSGTASPEGVTFPGAYKDGDIGLTFKPYFGRGSDPVLNAKYVSPLLLVQFLFSNCGDRLLPGHHYTRASTMPPWVPLPS
jgi:hypothetical protein